MFRKLLQNLKILLIVFLITVLCIVGYFVAIFGTFLVLAIGLFYFIKLLCHDPDKNA